MLFREIQISPAHGHHSPMRRLRCGIVECIGNCNHEAFITTGRNFTEILLNGNHEAIAQWRREQSEARSRARQASSPQNKIANGEET